MKNNEEITAETTVLDQSRTATVETEILTTIEPSKPVDREFNDLVIRYNRLVQSRNISHPVDYHFVKELGHGCQGIVFLVTRSGARGCLTHHAIKLLTPEIYSSASMYWTDMGRIARQVSLLQSVNNSNLVSRDFYEECDGVGYSLMQVIDGVDLRVLLDNRYLEIARSRSTKSEWKHFTNVVFRVEDNRISLQTGMTLYIIRNVLRGLSALHDNGFIHGDIKPTNIMIDIQGTVKLVDFGRAARIGEHVNILLGSPLYMAPEIHLREPGFIQSDIFSTGLVTLEMLNGRSMSEMSSKQKSLMDFKTSLTKRLNDYLPLHVSGHTELRRVLNQFLAPDIRSRFTTARKASESGRLSLSAVRQRLGTFERETEYERELEAYLKKLADPQTGKLNPHFGSDNITAVILT